MRNTKIKFTLEKMLTERNMTQKELALKTGLRESTLSDMKRRNALNLSHVATICEALGVTDISEALELTYDK
ncbi:helix-turn-helix transcriptional regulator [Priestia megaterium]|uniref:helix-turn-helix domain-containing protein n=1 Tax=Priestia megaterium TaxID=1404 RepID=UPI0030096476